MVETYKNLLSVGEDHFPVKLESGLGYLCIFPLCFLAAPVLLDWVYSLVDSEIKKLHDWHQEYKLVISSGALPTVLYTRSFSTAWAFVKLISNFEIPNFLFLPLCSWFSSSCKGSIHACLCAQLLQSCLTLCNPVDHSPPGSSIHGILPARVLEWVPMPSSRGIFPMQGSNPHLLCGRWILYLCKDIWEAQVSAYYTVYYTVSYAFSRMQIVNCEYFSVRL